MRLRFGNLTPSPSSTICYLTQIELLHFSPLCLYFRPNCVNLPKSLSFYKLFSLLCPLNGFTEGVHKYHNTFLGTFLRPLLDGVWQIGIGLEGTVEGA